MLVTRIAENSKGWSLETAIDFHGCPAMNTGSGEVAEFPLISDFKKKRLKPLTSGDCHCRLKPMHPFEVLLIDLKMTENKVPLHLFLKQNKSEEKK